MIELGPKYNPSVSHNIRFVGFDVDGTLVLDNSDHLPSQTFLEQITRATQRGMNVGIIGARGLTKTRKVLRTMLDAATDKELVRYSALANGALIYDAQTDDFIEKNTIPITVAQQITDYLQHSKIPHWVHELRGKDSVDFVWLGNTTDGQPTYGTPINMWDVSAAHNQHNRVDYEVELPLVIVADGVTMEQRESLMQLVAGFKDSNIKCLTYHFNEANKTSQIFIHHTRANKGTALETLARLYEVPLAQCAVFGDGGNDEHMFEVATRHGGLAMAMGNAAVRLKEKATHILSPQNEDGAAKGLKFILDECIG